MYIEKIARHTHIRDIAKVESQKESVLECLIFLTEEEIEENNLSQITFGYYARPGGKRRISNKITPAIFKNTMLSFYRILLDNDILSDMILLRLNCSLIALTQQEAQSRGYHAGFMLTFSKKDENFDLKTLPLYSKYFHDTVIETGDVCDDDDDEKTENMTEADLLDLNKTPSQIKEYLDKHIIAQEEAKRVVSVAVYNHYKCLKITENDKSRRMKKNNVLILGPTGSGKTEIARTIAELLHLPFVSISAASFTASGYVGEDVSSMFARLHKIANGDVELAQKGIIFIDEFDKIATVNSSGRDIKGGMFSLNCFGRLKAKE